MIKEIKYLSILLGYFWCFSPALAQREVVIEPTQVGILNDVINGDTTELGARVDPNTVYVLKRNGFYKTTGTIQNQGFHLTIEAEQGDGAMPILQPTAPSGGESQNIFSIFGDFTVRGVYMTAVDDFGRYLQRLIRVQNNNAKVIIDQCWMDGTGQSFLRLDNEFIDVTITNSIASNIGRTFVPNNGRMIDSRATTDSIIVKNNTIFNLTSRVLRISDGSFFKYVNIDHNTIVNSAQRCIGFDFTLEGYLTNNILASTTFLGSSRNTSESIEADVMPESLINSIGRPQSLVIANNAFFTDEYIKEIWADSITERPLFDGNIYDIINEDSATLWNDLSFFDPIHFENSPRVNAAVVSGMIFDQLFAVNIDDGDAPNWSLTSSPFQQLVNQNFELDWEFPYSFSYSPDSYAANAGTDGLQLGDLNWPLKDTSIILGTSSFQKRNISLFPNPVENILNLRIQSGKVQAILIFNALGQKLEHLENIPNQLNLSFLPRGNYHVQVLLENGERENFKIIKK